MLSGAIFAGLVYPVHPLIPTESPTALIPPWFAINIGSKVHELFSYLAFVTTPKDAYVIDLATSYWKSEVAFALTENKIIDSVDQQTASGGTVSCEAVAENLNLQAFVVCQYMEAGMHLNLLKKDAATKEYSLTPHGLLLTETGNLRDFTLFANRAERHAWRAVATHLVKDGGKPNLNSGWEIATGKEVGDYFTEFPEEGAEFDRAMEYLNSAPSGAMILDWKPPSEDAKFCEIGGGVGMMLGEMLNHYPKMTGVVFEQPEGIDRIVADLDSMGVADRAKVVSGRFFDEELPEELADCDVFFLRSIVRELDDDSSVTILKNIRNVTKKSNKNKTQKVVIMDQLIGTGAPSFLEKAKSLLSITMVAAYPYGAKKRTLQEHVDLFQAAGYKNVAPGINSATNLVPLRATHSIVQVDF